MKIKKRFVAFMMAVLMVLTSITIQYRKSEAATVTAIITVNFDAKDVNKAVKVTVGDKSFDGTVTKINIPNEDGTASENYKYQVTGDLEVETGDKTAVVTYDNGNSVCSAQTALKIPETPDPTTNKYAVETGVVTLLLTTVKEVTVTGVDGYTFTSVTGAERVGDSWIFKKADGFKNGDKFTINAQKGNATVTTEITVTSEQITATWNPVSFQNVEIEIGEDWSNISVKNGETVLGTSYLNGVLTINGTINFGTKITVEATNAQNIKHQASIKVNAEKIQQKDVKFQALQYEMNVTDNGVDYQIYSADGKVISVSKNKAILNNGEEYTLVATASAEYKVIEIKDGRDGSNNVLNTDKSIDNNIQTATLTFNDIQNLKLSERDAKIANVQIDNTGDKIAPEIALPISSTVTMEDGFSCPDDMSREINVSKSTINVDNKGSKIFLPYTEDLNNGEKITVTVTAKYAGGTKTSDVKQFTVDIKDVQYGRDYEIKNAKNVYADPNAQSGQNGADKIYYSSDGDKTACVMPKSIEYSHFRYRSINETKYTDFAAISSNSEIYFTNGSGYLQMKNDDKNLFGVSKPVQIIKDDDIPEITTNSVAYEIFGDSTNANDKSNGIVITVKDNASGLSKWFISDNGELTANEISKMSDTRDNYQFAEGNELTYYIYAVDNVGNIAKKKIIVTVDTSAPKITVNNDDTNLTDGSYINNNSEMDAYKLRTVSVLLEDPNLKSYSVEIQKKDENTDKYTVVKNAVEVKETSSSATNKNIIASVKENCLTDGIYKLVITADDIFYNANNTKHRSVKEINFVVDNTVPTISSAKATPVKLPETGDFSNLKDNYIAYNANSEIVVEFNDDNIDTGNAVTSGLVANNEIISASPIPDTNNEYSASYSMGDHKLAETLNLDKSNATITVTDKAGNATTKDITYDEKNALAKTDKTVVLIKTPTTLNTLEVINNDKIFVNSVNGVTGSVQFANTSDTVVDTDFFNVKVVKSADTADTTVVSGTATKAKDETKFAFHIEAKDKLKNDEAYKVVTQYYDVASYDYQSKEGVTRLVESPEYVYDNVAPVISEPVFSNENGTITYTLTEKHPDFKNFDVKVETAINNEGNIANDIAARLTGAWKDNKDGTYTNVITLDTEGKYTISITPIDKATNVGKTISETYIYDKTAPTLRSETAGVPTVEVKTAKETKNTDYSKFDETKAVVTVHAYDLVADSLKKSVFTLKDSTGKVITVTGDKLTETKKNGMFTESFEIDPNFKGSLSFVLEDSNKNVSDEMKYTYANGNLKGIVVENGEKHESVSEAWIREVNASAAENGIYNEDIKLNLYAEDMYSGLSSVSFVAMNKDDGAIIAQYSEDIESRTENSGVQYTWNKNDQVISALKKNEGNNIELWFSAQDNAGHKISAETKTVKIDVTAPKVTVTYDNNSPVNEKYFNATRTATIEVKDYNFISSGITLDIKKNGAPMNVAPNFSTDRVVKKDESGKPYYTYVMTLPFAEDGDYDFTVSARDAAGNVGTLGRTDSFTIDKTNPDMSIAFDNNNPYSGQYYGDSRTATITIKEHNFNASDVKVNVTASVDGSSVSAPSVSAFSTSGDVHTASVTFNGDADYTISASCVDLAGNEGNNIEEQSFTVDQTAPEIKITGVKADESYTGSVSPVVTVTDGNYDTEGVTVNIVGGKHGKSKVSSSVSDIAHGQTYSFADLQHTQDNDDYYTLTAKAVDKAGHETEETIAYKVNRFGSVYVMNDALQAAVDQYYATSSDKYAIIEQNVDELDSYTVSYSVDNEIVNLEENKGYKVSHKTNKEDWQEYEYKLDADTFSKEGVYNISISSKDTAGNASDNKSKNVEMEFCIDNTKPSCIISGVEENQKFDKGVAANIVVEAYDNIKFGDMQISVNGSQIKSEKDMTDGKVSFTIDPAKGDQTLKVVCHDAAGNETVQEVHFTFNMGVLNSGSPVAIIIIVIAVAAAAAVGFFLIAKKKKNGK